MALVQAEQVADLLQQHNCATTLLPLSTKGDEILDRPLAEMGGKALFIKGLEKALLAGEADIAVHSMKDVPAALDSRFAIAAVLPRPTAFDALVSVQYASLAELPAGAVVGSSSPRRQAQLLLARPDLKCRPVRGNVFTRMQKMMDGDYDALLLSAAGLARVDQAQQICEVLQPPVFIPAATQGVICIEVLRERLSELVPVLSPLNDHATFQIAGAEREMVKGIGGDCHSPIAAYATVDGGVMTLMGSVLSTTTRQHLTVTESAPVDGWCQLGASVAVALNAQGAQALLGLE